MSNFFGRYEAKIKEWEDLMESDPENRDEYEAAMHDYMIDCIPFFERLSETSTDKHTIDTIFASKSRKGIQRKEIFHEYLRKVEDFKGAIEDETVKDTETVPVCRCGKMNMVYDEIMSEDICVECGATQFFIKGDETNLTFNEEQDMKKPITYSYKRDNHFNEWILQFQANETTNIPETVIDQLRAEFKKQKIKSINEITHAKVRALLKKLRMNKYYEHVPYIANILSGINPPKMSQALEHRLRLMFRDVQEPFDKHCPDTRTNFLSYSYTLYKFCELLGEDAYLPCFPLLKSAEKLRQQDVIWRNMCHDLQWEFIPTV